MYTHYTIYTMHYASSFNDFYSVLFFVDFMIIKCRFRFFHTMDLTRLIFVT